jgi:pimeloyl-ACP methyl ester carboxylesterase
MYHAPAWRSVAGARFLEWPKYNGERSIGAFADRVIREAEISDGATVIGSSFGGIVACEIARKRKLQSLVLIGSAVKPDEVSALLAVLHPLVRLTPIEFVQTAMGKLPSELTEMFSRSEAPFIRAACTAIFEWGGFDEAHITPVRLHGRRDRVIPLPAPVDLALDGGHLIAMSHPDECVGFLKARLLI